VFETRSPILQTDVGTLTVTMASSERASKFGRRFHGKARRPIRTAVGTRPDMAPCSVQAPAKDGSNRSLINRRLLTFFLFFFVGKAGFE
jgi:hypothetical protein